MTNTTTEAPTFYGALSAKTYVDVLDAVNFARTRKAAKITVHSTPLGNGKIYTEVILADPGAGIGARSEAWHLVGCRFPA
jgi:hypothetical protein